MAVSFFRQWFAQSISDDRTRRAPDGGYNFYSALRQGGAAYLSHLDFQEFHKFFPMSLKACQLLEANMGVLKEDIKRFVDEMMVERTHLKRDEQEIAWLTCANIEKDDLPWYKPGTPQKSTDTLPNYDELDEDSIMDDNARAQALAVASSTKSGKKSKRDTDSGSSDRPQKRARANEEGSASGSDYYPESTATNGMFVSEDGDAMQE